MFSLITACAGNAVNDDLMQAVEDSYNDASTVINKAESYNLKVSDAISKLSQSSEFFKEEKYTESITSSSGCCLGEQLWQTKLPSILVNHFCRQKDKA